MTVKGLLLLSVFALAVVGNEPPALAQDPSFESSGIPPIPGDPSPNSSGVPPAPGGASAGDAGLNLDMKLEDLVRQDVVVSSAPGFSTVVSTVDRQTSTIGRTPAAVFVITNEMIKRSGARTVPDALRMAPGVDVARLDAHTWAISIRGFNNRFANKLLVQIDGRIVYSETFGGVYWDLQDVVLADVERIEVIRGPGTTMWGSNAVNGVINILTKKASATQGALVQSGGGGEEQQDFNTVRYGGHSADGLVNWRAFGQQFDRAPGWSEFDVPDAWHGKHGGFRMDYTPNKEETYTLQGDLFRGRGGQVPIISFPTPPYSSPVIGMNDFPSGDILFRYERVFDDETSWQVQTYYDHFQYNFYPWFLEQRGAYDIDLQYQFSPWERHQFITGATYRTSRHESVGSFYGSLVPPDFTTNGAGIFAQDTIALEEDRWYFTLGARLEYNTFGGLQPEPTARLLFLPTERQSMWCAVSRAAKNPTCANTQAVENLHFGPPNVPIFGHFFSEDTEPEDLVAYEVGYRAAPTDEFSWDIAGYINDYHKISGVGPAGTPYFAPPGLFIPIPFQNNTSAISYGFETTATYKLTDSWQMFGSYSLWEINVESPEEINVASLTGSSPHNMVYLSSSWDLDNNVQLDLIGRYVDRLKYLDVPKYFEMDARIAWQATKSLEISFVGQNLLDSHHAEFLDNEIGLIGTQVRRSWYGMVTWTF